MPELKRANALDRSAHGFDIGVVAGVPHVQTDRGVDGTAGGLGGVECCIEQSDGAVGDRHKPTGSRVDRRQFGVGPKAID